MTSRYPRIAVLGAGAWGTALACNAARTGGPVSLWGRSEKVVSQINSQRRNPAYLGTLSLEEKIVASTNLEECLGSADLILLSVPTQQLEGFLGEFPSISKECILITTCKGIDRTSGELPSQITANTFPDNPVAALSGPSFAHDVIAGLPTAVTIAAENIETADQVASVFSTDSFRCYSSSDILGVELGGALKNVLALAVGAARGMQLGASAEAALVARGFAEISRLAIAMGAERETLAGLSGLGDIVLTCSSPQSRNFTYGMALGRNEPLSELKLAEGAFTASVAMDLATEYSVDTPITAAIVNVLEKRVTAREAVSQLLTRPLKRES